MTAFSEKLLKWYKINCRALPWRETKDPYTIWLSEVILQQTRVEQGAPYYKKFISEFPKIELLAKSSEKKILKLWQGLGYYSRARNLHYSAKKIIALYGKNGFPKTYNELLSLKGVGKYTAAAISSIAFNEKKAAVDGNVYRVLSRIFGIKNAINSPVGQRVFNDLANELICEKSPGDFNQAIMDFGSVVCTPKKPNCSRCLFSDACFAFKNNEINTLPIKLKKQKKTTRYLYFFDVLYKKKRLLKKRENKKDIWFGLYEFPIFETEAPLNENKALKLFSATFNFDTTSDCSLVSIKKYKHLLTHQNINACFYTIKAKTLSKDLAQDFILVSSNGLNKYPFPILIIKYLKSIYPNVKIY